MYGLVCDVGYDNTQSTPNISNSSGNAFVTKLLPVYFEVTLYNSEAIPKKSSYQNILLTKNVHLKCKLTKKYGF
jgi:hypothetical protein